MPEGIGLSITPTAPADPTASPEHAEVASRTDTGGRTQVRVSVSPTPSVDPADPKPEKAEGAADDKPAAEPTPTARPSWLPEKFATPQALKDATVELAKKQGAPGYVIRGIELSESGQEVSDAYKEFERKIDPNAGKPAEPKAEEPKPEEKPAEEKPAPEVPAASKSAEDKAYEVETLGPYVAGMLDMVGVRAVDIQKEFQENGEKLTEVTYAKFEKAGVSRTFLNAYISGAVGTRDAMAASAIADVKATVGGEVAFGKLAVWAQANLSKEQHEIYSSMTNSGSVVAAKEAVKMLKKWHDDSAGEPPVVVVKPTTGAVVVENKGYESKEEMMKDMNDPRYLQGDKAFHKLVEQKLLHTNL